jgi:hypothetical protein
MTIGVNNAPVLESYMACRDRVSMIMGPLGSGKTYGSIQRLLAQMVEQQPNAEGVRPSRWIVVRNTYPDLMGTTIKDFREIFTEPHFGKFKMGSLEPPTFFANFLLEDGTRVKSEVVFMALDRPQHENKLRGVQATGAWFNEVKEIAKAIVDMADSRIGRYPSMAAGGVRCTWHGMIGDTNAPDEDSWYAKSSMAELPGWNFFRQPAGVLQTGQVDHLGNPLYVANPKAENKANLPPDYYENLVINKATDWIKVNVENEFGFYVDGKPVHPNYVDSVHCPGIIPYNPAHPIAVGVDFGRTPAATIIQIDPMFGRKSIIDEFGMTNSSAALFGPELFRYLKETYPGASYASMWGDPAGDAGGQNNDTTPFTVLHAAGLPVQPCETNAKGARRSAIATPLTELCMDGRPRLLVSAKAKMTRKGLQGGFCYKRLQVSNERYGEEPDKNEYSHFVESAEYALLGVGEYHMTIKPSTTSTHATRPYLAITE